MPQTREDITRVREFLVEVDAAIAARKATTTAYSGREPASVEAIRGVLAFVELEAKAGFRENQKDGKPSPQLRAEAEKLAATYGLVHVAVPKAMPTLTPPEKQKRRVLVQNDWRAHRDALQSLKPLFDEMLPSTAIKRKAMGSTSDPRFWQKAKRDVERARPLFDLVLALAEGRPTKDLDALLARAFPGVTKGQSRRVRPVG